MCNNKNTSLQEFRFNTGVKWQPGYPDIDGHLWVNAVGGGLVKVIPFYCKDVPEGATFLYACDNPDYIASGENKENIIVREIYDSAIVSKYAFFRIKN